MAGEGGMGFSTDALQKILMGTKMFADSQSKDKSSGDLTAQLLRMMMQQQRVRDQQQRTQEGPMQATQSGGYMQQFLNALMGQSGTGAVPIPQSMPSVGGDWEEGM